MQFLAGWGGGPFRRRLSEARMAEDIRLLHLLSGSGPVTQNTCYFSSSSFWGQVEGTLSVNLLDAHHELPRPSGQGLSRLTARSKMPRQFIATAVNRDGSSRAVMSDGQCDNRIRKEPLCASVLIEIIININIAFLIITIIARY